MEELRKKIILQLEDFDRFKEADMDGFVDAIIEDVKVYSSDQLKLQYTKFLKAFEEMKNQANTSK